MISLIERLENGDILLSDGAVGTVLFPEGVNNNICVEKINLTHPKHLEIVAQNYLDAGADIIQTNTFGASPSLLEQHSLDDYTQEINRNAVIAVRNVVKNNAYLSFTVGPTGHRLLASISGQTRRIRHSYQKQFEAVRSLSIDLISIETMMFLEEALIAVELAKEYFTGIPISVSFMFKKQDNNYITYDDFPIDIVAKRLAAAGVDIIGSNCGEGSKTMIDTTITLRKATDKFISIRPSAGIPVRNGDELVYPDNIEIFSQSMSAIIKAGANIVGGCCGTTPDYIINLKKILSNS